MEDVENHPGDPSDTPFEICSVEVNSNFYLI